VKNPTAAPLLGQNNEEIYCGRLGYSKQDLVKLAKRVLYDEQRFS